jgi:transposase-like protein
MAAVGLRAKAVRGYRAKAAVHQRYARHPNLLWKTEVTTTNQVWVGDITYFKVAGCWWYLAIVMDQYSRRILAWSLTRRRTSSVTCAVLAEAARRRPAEGAIFHSDRGTEYMGAAFCAAVVAHGMRQSASVRGPGDNAHAESFWHSLKAELTHGATFLTDHALRTALRQYIRYYNRTRLHSSLSYTSPILRALRSIIHECSRKWCKIPNARHPVHVATVQSQRVVPRLQLGSVVRRQQTVALDIATTKLSHTIGAVTANPADAADRQARLKELADGLKRILPDKEYYHLTLTAAADGTLRWGAYTHFAGFTEGSPRYELREASIVHAERMASLYRDLGETCLVVNNDRSLYVFLTMGGHALIERSVAEARLPDQLRPTPVGRTGPAGFHGIESARPGALQHAPSKKQRLRVLKRDGYRCLICGERPADNVHITLHVHHVWMWSHGGLTDDSNLITICQTCHDGLEPHQDFSLFGLIPGGSLGDHLGRARRDYADGVRRYREVVGRVLQRESTSDEAKDGARGV